MITIVIIILIALPLGLNAEWQIRHERRMHEMRVRHEIQMRTHFLRSIGASHLRVIK